MTMRTRSGSTAPALVAGAVGLTLALTVVLAARQMSSPSDLVSGYALDSAMWSVVLGLTGALVLRDSPGNRLGPLLAGIGLWFGVGNVTGALAPLLPRDSAGFAWCTVINGLWAVAVPALFLVPLLYPDGHPISPRWVLPARITSWCIPVVAVAASLAPQITQSDQPGMSAVNPLGVDALSPVPLVVALVAVALSLVLGVAGLVGQVRHARGRSGEERVRVGYLVAMMVLLLVAIPVTDKWVNFAVQLLAATSLAVGVVRHHMFDVGRALSRSVVYAVLVGSAVLAALGTAALLGTVSDVGVLPAIAAAIAAIVVASTLGRIQAGVDRVVVGPRQDAATALGLLGDRLAGAAEPEDALPMLVSTVRESLRLPYAAVRLAGEDGPAAEDGPRPERTVSYPLTFGGQNVGSLEIGPAPGDTSLDRRAAALVRTLASQAGAVAHSAQTMRELRRSREALVTAREEERRSLRRDLHDGLGPTLAGMSLGRQSLERGATDEEQARLAAELLAQSRQSLDEVRRMARDLRPAALDELGLADALRQHAQTMRRMSGGALDVEVTVAGDLPELPAAVEVAAYRISQEALSNTTRHADATRCVIDLAVNGWLVLTIADDGTGVAPPSPGTGLRSMRARADELGGTCTVTFRPGVGTEVLAQLPVGVVS